MNQNLTIIARVMAVSMLVISMSQGERLHAALIASYQLNETSGTSAFDSSGNSRTATIAGGTTLGVAGNPYPDPSNKAFQFDGINDTVTRTGDAGFAPGTFTANTGWTVETWIKLAPGNTSNGGFITWYRQSGNFPTYQLMLDGAGHPRGWVRDDAGAGTGAPFATSTTDIRDNDWHHLALTLGHDALNSPFRSLYLDGALVGSDTTSALGTLSGTTALTIGWFDGVSDSFLAGTIDEVNIYSHALTAAEILANFNAGVEPPPVPVPEPTSLMLLGLGTLVLLRRRQR